MYQNACISGPSEWNFLTGGSHCGAQYSDSYFPSAQPRQFLLTLTGRPLLPLGASPCELGCQSAGCAGLESGCGR